MLSASSGRTLRTLVRNLTSNTIFVIMECRHPIQTHQD